MKELDAWRRVFADWKQSQPGLNVSQRAKTSPRLAHAYPEKSSAQKYAFPSEIRAVEVEAESEANLSVTMINGERQGAAANDQTELFVRVQAEVPDPAQGQNTVSIGNNPLRFVPVVAKQTSTGHSAPHLDGAAEETPSSSMRTGFTYTQDLEEDPVTVIRRAYESSQYAQAVEPMNDGDSALHFDGAVYDQIELTEVSVLWEITKRIDEWLGGNAPEMTMRHLTVTSRVRTLGILNTKGCDRTESYGMISVSLLGVSAEHGSLEKEWTFSADQDIPASLFQKDIKKWKRSWLPTLAISSGTYPAILDGNVMTNILLTSWQMFSALKYESMGTPYAGKLGEQIANPVLQIEDRVSISQCGFQFKLDCQGSTGIDVGIVRDGKLTGLMHSLATAASLHASPTGNAGRKTLLGGNIHTETLITPKNFGIMPGDADFDDLLRELRDGLYIFESFDVFHSINVASGEFSIPCNAILVEQGRMTGRVDGGITMTGKVQDLFAAVTEVGNDTEILPMIMLNSYTVFSPSVLISGIYVSE